MDALVAGDDNSNAVTGAVPIVGDKPTHAPAGTRSPDNSGDSRQREGNVGQALRSVYQQTVNEDVPDEMLKLLGQLI